jgi:uncharacterized protein (DUF433 family)
MKLESYFDFINEDAIRIAGTRVNIETVLRDYQQGAGPEEIVLRYPTISLEQVHATITYYLANWEKMQDYLGRVETSHEEAWRDQERHPSEFIQSLRDRLDRERSKIHKRKPQLSFFEG